MGIKLWTHKIDGLTESEFVLAAKLSRLFFTKLLKKNGALGEIRTPDLLVRSPWVGRPLLPRVSIFQRLTCLAVSNRPLG